MIDVDVALVLYLLKNAHRWPHRGRHEPQLWDLIKICARNEAATEARRSRKLGPGAFFNRLYRPYSDTWLECAPRGPVDPARLPKILGKSRRTHREIAQAPRSRDRSVAVGIILRVEKGEARRRTALPSWQVRTAPCGHGMRTSRCGSVGRTNRAALLGNERRLHPRRASNRSTSVRPRSAVPPC
jgi:hypothetical protein